MHVTALEELSPFLRQGSIILDVGCGSGFLTACMANMVGDEGRVYGIDIIPYLVDLSKKNISRMIIFYLPMTKRIQDIHDFFKL